MTSVSRLALLIEFLCQAKRPAQAQSRFPLLGFQVNIPRTHRQAVGFAGGLHADDLDVHIQILHHSLDRHILLEIFPAEDGHMGLHDMKQLRADRGHPAEKTGAGSAAEVVCHPLHLDIGLIPFRVHLPIVRRKDPIDADPFRKPSVSFEIPRIGFEVLRGGELRGVDIDAHGKAIRRCSRPTLIRFRCPSWKYPIVGTKAILRPRRLFDFGNRLHLFDGLNDLQPFLLS